MPDYKSLRGMQLLREAHLNKGVAFTEEERKTLGLDGLLPPVVQPKELQFERVKENLSRKPNDLEKYFYLMGLHDRNEQLFYYACQQDPDTILPLVYTPTVGQACQEFGHIIRGVPRGMFISINDRGHIREILENWPDPSVRAIIVTDGERILGLGDLGANGMGIPIGKTSLCTGCAGVPPNWMLPITLDVGTNNEKLLEDPLYIGLKRRRASGKEYDDFMDEFMEATESRFGPNILIQFEDFGHENALRLLEKYDHKYCAFNDDIQGTAAVVVAGILSAQELMKKRLEEMDFLFIGAGMANVGIAKLLMNAMEQNGISTEDARKRMWLMDSKGLLTKSRLNSLDSYKRDFVKDHEDVKTVDDMVEKLKPAVIIGACAQAEMFTEKAVRTMAKAHERPLIFALSNPTNKSECTAEQAYTWSEGRAIFSSGSPFDPVTLNGKKYITGQANNCYIFPGMILAVTSARIKPVENSLFLTAAESIAHYMKRHHSDLLSQGCLYPPLRSILDVSLHLATFVVHKAQQLGITLEQLPEDIQKEIAEVRYIPYITGINRL